VGKRGGVTVTTLSGVYRITIGPDSYYYGSSNDLARRKKSHVADLKNQKHYNYKMQRAWDKYQQFAFEIVELCHTDDLVTREQFYLDKSIGIGDPRNMNISFKALPGRYAKHSDETKEKISQALKGRTFTDEWKKKISQARKGIKPSDETKKKMSQAHMGHNPTKGFTGRKHSDESKRKMSQAKMGRKYSAQHVENILRGRRAYFERNRS
jgi:group I intron endonuclease